MTDSPLGYADFYDIFISHHRLDAEPVQRLAQALEAVGVRYCLDDGGIGQCGDSPANPPQALANAKALLVWYSKDFLQSATCQQTLATAFIAQQAGLATDGRILTLNPELGDGHIYPKPLRKLTFADVGGLGVDGDFSGLALLIKTHCAGLKGGFGETAFNPPRRYDAYGRHREASAYCIGRNPALWELHDALHQTDSGAEEEPGPVVVISGMAGQGKSLLAQAYARRFGAAYPGGVFWLDAAEALVADLPRAFNENPPLQQQLAALLAQLQDTYAYANLDTLPPPQLLTLMADMLARQGQAFLWIVDNLPGGLNDNAFRQWLAPSTDRQLGRTLLITHDSGYDGIATPLPLPLPPLDLESAYQLLIRNLPPANAAERQAAQALATDLGGYALAVRVAGAGVAHEARHSQQPYQAFRQRLSPLSTDVLETIAQLVGELPDGHARCITATLLHSLNALERFGQDVVTIATMLAKTPLPKPLLAETFSLCDGLDEAAGRDRCAKAIASLLGQSLAEERDGEVWLHPLVVTVHYLHDGDTGRQAQLYRAVLAALCTRIGDCFDQEHWQPFAAYASHAHVLLASSAIAEDEWAALNQWVWLGYYLGDMERHYGAQYTALAMYMTIRERVGQLAERNPEHIGWLRDLAVGHARVANVLLDQGKLADALKDYRACLAITEQLVAQYPDDTGWRHDLVVSHNSVGDVLLSLGDLAGALASFNANLTLCGQLLAQDPNHARWRRDLSISHEKVGDVSYSQGDLAGALASFHLSLAIRKSLAAQDPNNTEWQCDLYVSHIKIGDALCGQGDLAGALAHFRLCLDIAAQMAEQDPGHAGWRRNLAAIHTRIGDMLRDQGELAEALENFLTGLSIFEQMAEQAPGDTDWLRDMAINYNKIGGIFISQGEPDEALACFRASQDLYVQLVEQEPDQIAWLRSLSISHDNIGDVLRDQGDLAEALASFRFSLAIRWQLAKLDSNNAERQTDLAFSHGKVGVVLWQMQQPDPALAEFQAALAILEPLALKAPEQTQWQQALAFIKSQIAEIVTSQRQNVWRKTLRRIFQ